MLRLQQPCHWRNKKIHKATWVSPAGQTENQIDHFCISRKLRRSFRRSLEDVRVLRGADVGSDHHLLIAKVKIKLKKHRKENHGCRIKYQVNLLQDKDKREEFHLELSNKFQALENLEEKPIEDHWEEIKGIVTTTCSSVLRPKKQNHKDWVTKESLDKIKKRREIKEEINKSRSEEEKRTAREKYSEAHKAAKDIVRKDKQAYLEDKRQPTAT